MVVKMRTTTIAWGVFFFNLKDDFLNRSPIHHKPESSTAILSVLYHELHRPASEFPNRAAYLNHELQIMSPRRYALNLPGRDFRFEPEDLISALSGAIGVTVMLLSIMISWAEGLNGQTLASMCPWMLPLNQHG